MLLRRLWSGFIAPWPDNRRYVLSGALGLICALSERLSNYAWDFSGPFWILVPISTAVALCNAGASPNVRTAAVAGGLFGISFFITWSFVAMLMQLVGQHVQPELVLPLLLGGAVGGVIAQQLPRLVRARPSVLLGESQPRRLQPMQRRCPFCAELIQPAAIKCKHCGSEVTPSLESFDRIELGEVQPKEQTAIVALLIASIPLCWPLPVVPIVLLWRRRPLPGGWASLGALVGGFCGYYVGFLFGYLNRPTYALGYRPSSEEIGQNPQLASDAIVSLVAYAGSLTLLGAVVGAMLGLLAERNRRQ